MIERVEFVNTKSDPHQVFEKKVLLNPLLKDKRVEGTCLANHSVGTYFFNPPAPPVMLCVITMLNNFNLCAFQTILTI